MTNYEHFKSSKNILALAKMLYKFDNHEPFQCDFCECNDNSRIVCNSNRCIKAIIEWLKSEYKDDI